MNALSHAGARRHRFAQLYCLTLLAGALAIACGCGTPVVAKPEAAVVTETAWPKELNLCYVPPEDEPQKLAKQEMFRKLEGYLSKKLNMPVKTVESGSYNVSIEAMRADKIDVCEFGAFSYILAHKVANAQPMIVRGTPDKKQSTYRSVIITSASSGIESLDAALAKADQLTLSFTDPASTSGHLVPRGYLDTLGVKPEEKFKEVTFSMSHLTSVLTAINGKTDLAAVADAALANMQEKGAIKESDYRILWTSPPMPGGPVAIRGDLPADFQKVVQQAYLDMQQDDPDCWKAVSGQYHMRNSVYMPGDDSTFDYYRSIARGVEHMNLLD